MVPLPQHGPPHIVVSIVAMVVVVHVHAVLIRIAKKNATTRRPTIFVQTLQDSPPIDPVRRSHG